LVKIKNRVLNYAATLNSNLRDQKKSLRIFVTPPCIFVKFYNFTPSMLFNSFHNAYISTLNRN